MFDRAERDGIVVLTMTHGRANAWDLEFVEGFLEQLRGASTARAVILTAPGRIFSAGVDLLRLLEEGRPYLESFLPRMNVLVRELFAFPAPVVAAVNGHAIAGGGIIALCSDYVLMADGDARIGIPELTVGVPFPSVPLEVVRWALSGAQIRTLVNLGRTVRPDEAVRLGLVDEVVPAEALAERGAVVAAGMAGIPRESFTLTKRALRSTALERMDAIGAAYDREAVEAWGSAAVHEHLRAYLAGALGSGGR